MGEYFRPFRRIAGLLVLVMACLVMTIWMNSLMFRFRDPYLEGIVWDWNWRFAGIHAGIYNGHADISQYRFDVGNNKSLAVDLPYWPVVLTLTAISAWLLFSKPKHHRRNPRQAETPAAV